MTIFLPESLPLFRQAFDSTCQRILQCEKDAAFFELLVQLIEHVSKHALLKEHLTNLEAERLKQREIFCNLSLEELEESWIKLWKYHRKNFKHRKKLVAIKRTVTSPSEISYSLLYERILFKLWEFCYHSSFCQTIREVPALFHSSQSKLHCAKRYIDQLGTDYLTHKKIRIKELEKKDDFQKFLIKPIELTLPISDHISIKYSIEPLSFFSPKAAEIEKKFFIPGRNIQEKRQNMHIIAETNAMFCWERLQFLKTCYTTTGAFPLLLSLKGRWSKIKHAAWIAAWERCDKEALLGANTSLKNKLSHEPCSSIDSFLNVQYQIHRMDFEKHLLSFKNHVHSFLFKVESIQAKEEEDPRFMLPGSKKEDFVVQLARQFWNMCPQANRDMTYNYYFSRCPKERLLSRESFDRIVRKHKLDPRSKKEMKRGPGKKTLQN